jgi:uncharacterized protein YcbK (DUF882 family)
MLRKTRLCPTLRSPVAVAAATGALALLFLVGGLAHTENAIANGDTRTIYLYHIHTHESIAATFRVDGQYDPATLRQLNHFLRDWRNNDEINMDPKLFDVIWETYRESGSTQPIQVVSAYRSPTTNAMLRRRSKAVAENSQHILGKAMDMHYADVSMSKIREIALRLQRGGVGYYPTSGIPFVHLDVGNVRYWPRMSYDALARLFPDGKAVFLAADGRPLPHYQEARAEIAAARGNEPVPSVAPAQPKNFFAMLFGGGDNQGSAPAPAPQPRAQTASFGRAAESEPTASVQPAVAPITTDKQQKTAARVASLDERKSDGGLVLQAGAPGQPQPGAETATDLRPAPLPPHRPIELAALTADAAQVPLPPARPAPEASGVTPLLRAANVPAVITQGSSMPVARSPAGAALAYAASMTDGAATPTIQAVRTPASPRPAALAPAVGLRAAMLQKPVEFVAARLNPSNFSALVAPTPMARTTSESELGATVGALRSAARFSVAQLVFGPPSPVTVHFGTVVSDLRTGSFTGPAVRPLGLLFSESAPADAAEGRRFD